MQKQTPDTIPYREQEHGYDTTPEYPENLPAVLGSAKTEQYWGNDAEMQEEFEELERRDAARAELKGFGFCAARAAG
jgi:hypothetical protein